MQNAALGAGANIRACELKTPFLNPVEVLLADLFHFEAYNWRMNASLDACVYIANPSSCFSFLVGLQYRFRRQVPFVRALNSAITPVLWNSYGASIMIYPELTSIAVKSTTCRYQVARFAYVWLTWSADSRTHCRNRYVSKGVKDSPRHGGCSREAP